MTITGFVGDGVAYSLVPIGGRYPAAHDDGLGYVIGVGSEKAAETMVVFQRGQEPPIAVSVVDLLMICNSRKANGNGK